MEKAPSWGKDKNKRCVRIVGNVLGQKAWFVRSLRQGRHRNEWPQPLTAHRVGYTESGQGLG